MHELSANLEEKLKSIIKKYSSKVWLSYLRYFYEKKEEHLIIHPEMQDHMMAYLIAALCEKVIRWAEPDKKNDLISNARLRRDTKKAMNILFSVLVHDPHVPITINLNDANTLHFLARITQSQYAVRNHIFCQFHRLLFLYKKIPHLPEMQKYNSQFDFDIEFEFQKTFNLSIDEYLLYSFIIFADAKSANNKNGFFTIETLLALSRTIAPHTQEKALLAILKIISASKDSFEYSPENPAPQQVEYAYQAIPLLKLFPIIRFSASKEKILNTDSMISPLPHLVINRIHDAIYHQLKKQNGKFTQWFGRLLETYCGYVIQKSISSEKHMSEDDIRKKYPTQNGKTPDFALIKDDTAILIENKAARILRGFTESNDLEQFNKTLENARTAYSQLKEFSDAIKNKSRGLEEFHQVKKIYGIIITWEEYAPYISDTQKYAFFASDEKTENRLPLLILSIDQIEQLQPALSRSSNSFDDLLKLFNNLKDEIVILTKDIKSRHSFLDDYFSSWEERIFPSHVILESKRLIKETV